MADSALDPAGVAMSDVYVTLLWVQMAGLMWLAFVLQWAYLRVYREPFLRLWALSFAVLGLAVCWQLALRLPSSTEIVTLTVPYLLSLLQFPLIVLATLSLKPPVPSGRRQMLLLAGIMAGLLVVFLVTSRAVADPLKLARALRFERQVMGAAASGWFSSAFWRKHYLARTAGGRVTALFSALYTIYYTAVAIAVLGFEPYLTGYPVVLGVMANILPFGVATGMMVLASEALGATTKSLRDSEERYRTLVEASPDGIVATDSSGTILMCNRRAAELHGCAAAAELIGEQSRMLIAPADRERVGVEILPAVKEGRPISLECQILARDGSERSAQLTSAPLRAGDDTITGSVTIVHDITGRKEADRALRREREFSANAIDAIPGIFFVLDRQGKYVRWNRNLENLIALAPERIAGIDALVRIHPEDRPRVAGAIDAAFANGSAEIEARGFVGQSQEVRHFYMTGRRMELDGGVYLVGCGVDITERKEAEAARALLESQLLQSQKLESIGRLAGGVAHDFNNHLTVINGYCDLMLSRLAPDDPNRESLIEVLRAGGRAATLTRQLLAFGRKQLLSPSPVSLNRIVSSLETMLHRLVPENIEVATVLAPGLGAAMADTGQIEQVLMNLVTNARDAMPEGGSILIETANVDLESAARERDRGIGPGAYVTLSVTDTGIGMDERTRALIFEPFFTTKDLGKGTGLGLAMVHGIVHQSGGAIAVRSQPGAGSVFTVYLPRLAAEAGQAVSAPVVEGSRSGRGAILLVEDQEAVRSLLARVLLSSGYHVIEAGSGPQALALPDSQVRSIDLLITDLVMPGMSGSELATRLTARREGLRVLFISGYAPNAIVRQGIIEPGVAFLQKPFSPAQIAARIDEILSAK
jgi:PAS domain S-box-containing protein